MGITVAYRFSPNYRTPRTQVNSSDIPALEKELLDLDHPTDALVDVTIRKFQVYGRFTLLSFVDERDTVALLIGV